MTNKQLKNLKDTLWTTADQLRANSGLKSTEYAEPILGLIFLRFADVKYSKFEPEIKAEFNSTRGTRMERPIHEIAIEKCGFYLPEEARYDWLLNLPESEDLAKKIKEAMEAVEKYTAELEDTLPKDIYYSVNIMVSCIGTAGVVSINARPAHTNQQINSIILNNLNELEWLYHTCKSLKETIELFGATGATMTNLSKGKFEKLKVVDPGEDLILAYHNKVKPLFDEIKSLMYQNQNLAAQRDTLLPRLMSGKLEV